MMTILELHNAWLNKKPLIWEDPDYVEGNDYTLSYLEIFNENNILIKYNDGYSEAEVFLYEIKLK